LPPATTRSEALESRHHFGSSIQCASAGEQPATTGVQLAQLPGDFSGLQIGTFLGTSSTSAWDTASKTSVCRLRYKTLSSPGSWLSLLRATGIWTTQTVTEWRMRFLHTPQLSSPRHSTAFSQ